MNTKLIAVAAAAATSLAAPAYAAPMIGDTVNCASSVADCSAMSAIVSPAVEFTIGSLLSADFSTDQLTLTNISGFEFSQQNGVIVFTDPSDKFTVVSVQSSSGVTNFGTATIRSSDNALRIQFAGTGNGTTFAPGGSITFSLAPAATAVPELATWAMLVGGAGLAGVALRRRKPVVRYA